jgi:hypothetical protein
MSSLTLTLPVMCMYGKCSSNGFLQYSKYCEFTSPTSTNVYEVAAGKCVGADIS